jgi:ABC-type transport system involved in multi-copper enzyme maturation permease subunit
MIGVDVDRIVRGVYGGIATFLYTWGMFLAVFASAGLIPSVLEPGRIELLVSKPVSRTHILLGRYAGNVLVVSCNVIFLVLGIWTILGVKTGIWSPMFLISIATTIFIFAVLLAVVVLVGVLFESAALATMVTVALMIISPILAQTGLMMRLLSSEWSRDLWRTLYYSLPKVYDMGTITLAAIQSRTFSGFMPIWTSAVFGAVVLAVALKVFSRRDF